MNEATITTTHEHPEVIAAAISPDNTPEVVTTVEGATVTTMIERESIGGLRATITDYLRAVHVADRTAGLVTTEPNQQP